jgi:hypothetical protein
MSSHAHARSSFEAEACTRQDAWLLPRTTVSPLFTASLIWFWIIRRPSYFPVRSRPPFTPDAAAPPPSSTSAFDGNTVQRSQYTRMWFLLQRAPGSCDASERCSGAPSSTFHTFQPANMNGFPPMVNFLFDT